MHQHLVGAVLNLHELHVRGVQRGLHQGFEHVRVAGNHPEFRGWGQLVSNQLACVVELLTQILQAHKGKKADEHQGQQQSRAQAHHLGTGVNIPAASISHE